MGSPNNNSTTTTNLCPVCNSFVFTPEKTDTNPYGHRLTAKRGCIILSKEDDQQQQQQFFYYYYHADCYVEKFGPEPIKEEVEVEYCPTCGQLIMPPGEEEEEEEEDD